jgi:nucleoside-diphosphate-sugar epimerase
MRDLVTGATGFVGSHLVDALLARGRAVRCLVRDATRAGPLAERGAEVVEGELCAPPVLARALDGVDRVFHVAGGGKVSAMSQRGLEVLRVSNVAPVSALLEAARGRPLRRVVVFSSISAMGVQVGVRLDEDSPCLAVTPHEVVKVEAEAVAWREHREHGVPVVVLRPSQIYGPGDLRSEIPRLVRLAARGMVPLLGGGRGRVPWVHVADVVDATLLAADSPRAPGRTYIVSDRDSYVFRDVVQVIARALGRRRGGFVVPKGLAGVGIDVVERVSRGLGREPPFTRHRLESICGDRLLSIERARQELGYEPKVSLAEGMTATVRWYRERGLVA